MQAYIAEFSGNTIYFSGCDFNCGFCNTPEMLSFKEEFLIDIREIKQEIKNNNFKEILFTGGEPCLQRPALLELAKYAKKLGKRIILHTNGSKPNTLLSLFKLNLVDKIIFDIKAPFNETFEKVTKSQTFFKPSHSIMNDITESLKLIKENNIYAEFRTLVVPSLMYRKEDLLEIAKFVSEYDVTWKLNKFNNEVCLDKKYYAINPPTEIFLENIKEIILQKYPKLKVEV